MLTPLIGTRLSRIFGPCANGGNSSSSSSSTGAGERFVRGALTPEQVAVLVSAHLARPPAHAARVLRCASSRAFVSRRVCCCCQNKPERRVISFALYNLVLVDTKKYLHGMYR